MPVGTQYNDASVAEDVKGIIFQITPEDTPYYNMIGEGDANATAHQWETRALSTRNDNAQVEGATFSFQAPVLPGRVVNLTQIIEKTARVSGSSQASRRHSISNLVADQVEQRMVEWKTDVEHALLRGSAASGNASDTARRMDGLLNSVTTNATDFASALTLGETELNDLLQTVWDAGGKPADALVHGFLKRRISSFSGNAQKRFESSSREVINTIAIYESDFSTLSVQLSRDMPSGAGANALVVIDRSMFGKAWLRTPTTERVAKTADSIDTVILGELTHEYGNEAAAGLITFAA